MLVEVEESDVAERWRPLTAGESAIVATLLVDAADILDGALAERSVFAPPVPTDERWERTYIRVVATAAKRLLMNPEGFLSTAVTIDDYRQEYRRDNAVSAGELYVSDSEVDDLLPRKRRRRGAFSIALGNN